MLSRPVSSVALAPPVALVASRRRAHYLRGASASSVAIVASLSIGVGVGVIGLLCAILAACTLVVFCFVATRSRWVRRCLERHAGWRDRSRRDRDRERALRPAAPARRHQYRQLHDLVEEIEHADPCEANRLELQELLDHFVHLSARHQRCLESLGAAGDGTGPPTHSSGGAPTKHRIDIGARRRLHREECTTRLDTIADELDGIGELIRLVAERVACSTLTPSFDLEIDKRLEALDEVDEELGHLSA